MKCRVSEDEKNHDDPSITLYPDEVDKRAIELAYELIRDSDRLQQLVYDYELDIFGQLARIMRELEPAAMGNPISREAVLNAAALLEKLLLKTAMDEVRDQAVRQLSERQYTDY